MSKFIRLTRVEGTPFIVNVDGILSVDVDENGTILDLNDRCVCPCVQETPDQILALIEGDESGLKERKVVQITSTSVENTYATQCNYIVHALCSDGSIYELADTREWMKLPAIPTEAQS